MKATLEFNLGKHEDALAHWQALNAHKAFGALKEITMLLKKRASAMERFKELEREVDSIIDGYDLCDCNGALVERGNYD